MSRNRLTAAAASAAAAVAAIAILSGFATTHHTAAAPATHTAITHTTATHTTATHTTATATTDSAVQWLASPGGQAQVTFNQEVDTLAGALEIEAHAPTVANHLIFEADARTVRAQADKILATPTLLPTINRAAYQHMLHSFVTVTDMLQPGADYGTTSQDYTAWYAALNASNITVS
jgi:tRNA U34 5-carboxymethylaminomethyl modifying enzyme MnmG/GidA